MVSSYFAFLKPPLCNYHYGTSCRKIHLDARLIRGLVGTTVTTYNDFSDGPSPEPSSLVVSATKPDPSRATNSPATTSRATPSAQAGSTMTLVCAWSGLSQTWVITEKLAEKAAPATEHDFKMGHGTAKTVGKFLCHPVGDPKQIAFMRIYQQIPITGTEDADNATLTKQAVPPPVCGELECFKLLQAGRCAAVPQFLGHAESTQGEHDLLPGGYIRYIVWEKVPGVPLTEEFYWGLDDIARKDIRFKFRAAYEQMVRCGVAPDEPGLSKIIFDQTTGDVHISGFRRGWPIIDKLDWSESLYVAHGLAELSREHDWHLHPENWKW
ncbi:uncharacterized protein N7482_000829 [Penicillium canariense]|uniref:Uncharacterized protein n=1 Tax=Penicillium canariense TaxID=189055 RepID=A0A9W9IEI3_9EURO|nr:uncharacterized protein N7482_000829 [Penicillium canariense]KAJ5174952.1 hypothetical protein N7482_000829 [Penicillium canariense]